STVKAAPSCIGPVGMFPPESVDAGDAQLYCLWHRARFLVLFFDNQVHEVDIDAVSDCPLVGVLHDQVLIEEPQSLLGWRGGKADERGVEVLQHLAPEVVDGR